MAGYPRNPSNGDQRPPSFRNYYALLDKQPRLLKKVNDKGAGGVPPEYTAAVESAMRSHGDDLYAMGTSAMRSAADWKKVRRTGSVYCSNSAQVEPRLVLAMGPFLF